MGQLVDLKGRVVSHRPSAFSPLPISLASLPAPPGTHELLVVFSGEDIYQNKIEGPLVVKLTLLDDTGKVLDAKDYHTPKISFVDFGELPVRIVALELCKRDSLHHESGSEEPTNEAPVSASFHVVRPGTYWVQCIVSGRDSVYYSDGRSVCWEAGTRQLNFGTDDLCTDMTLRDIIEASVTIYSRDGSFISGKNQAVES